MLPQRRALKTASAPVMPFIAAPCGSSTVLFGDLN
jgi:hypothetical protein